MKAERPVVEDALAGLLSTHGLRVKKRPNRKKDHAGGKWDLGYRNGVAPLFWTLRDLLSTGWLWAPFVVYG